MDGFLLLARMTMDELALRLFPNKVGADHFSEHTTEEEWWSLIVYDPEKGNTEAV